MRRELITLGCLQGTDTRANQDIADYVLVYKNQKLAVIEVKRASPPVAEGLAQPRGILGSCKLPVRLRHQRVTLEFIQAYLIPIPSLSEQKRILSLLDKLSTSYQHL